MKKQKKHQFTHRDPEKTVSAEAKPEEQKVKIDSELKLYLIDFRKTLLTTGIFVLAVVLIYFLQIKTGLLRPVLKVFGL